MVIESPNAMEPAELKPTYFYKIWLLIFLILFNFQLIFDDTSENFVSHQESISGIKRARRIPTVSSSRVKRSIHVPTLSIFEDTDTNDFIEDDFDEKINQDLLNDNNKNIASPPALISGLQNLIERVSWIMYPDDLLVLSDKPSTDTGPKSHTLDQKKTKRKISNNVEYEKKSSDEITTQRGRKYSEEGNEKRSQDILRDRSKSKPEMKTAKAMSTSIESETKKIGQLELKLRKFLHVDLSDNLANDDRDPNVEEILEWIDDKILDSMLPEDNSDNETLNLVTEEGTSFSFDHLEADWVSKVLAENYKLEDEVTSMVEDDIRALDGIIMQRVGDIISSTE